MPATEPTKKVCIVCGTDVSGKPRVKNAAGQYVCKGACEAKIKSSQGGSDDLMAKLLEASPVLRGKPCANCGTNMKEGAVVCTNCGTNAGTGKKLKTAVIIEREPVKARSRPRDNGLLIAWVIFAVLSVIFVGIGLAPLSDPKMFIGTAAILSIIGWFIALGISYHLWREDYLLTLFAAWGLNLLRRVAMRIDGMPGLALFGGATLGLVLIVLMTVDTRWIKAVVASHGLGVGAFVVAGFLFIEAASLGSGDAESSQP